MVSAAGRDVVVDFRNRDGEVFHTGRITVPGGFDVEDLAFRMQEQRLMIPGMWSSTDGTRFEWEPVTELPPFETPHFEYAPGEDVTFALGEPPSGQRAWEMWRLGTDGVPPGVLPNPLRCNGSRRVGGRTTRRWRPISGCSLGRDLGMVGADASSPLGDIQAASVLWLRFSAVVTITA